MNFCKGERGRLGAVLRKDSCLPVLCRSTLKCQPASDSQGVGVALLCLDACVSVRGDPARSAAGCGCLGTAVTNSRVGPGPEELSLPRVCSEESRAAGSRAVPQRGHCGFH